ncbi:flavin-dependent dehydrogenase [Romeria aff. gracilis LEGE 07310]|uniref:Flavin-dependent dehydrogenase n=1 Tax=Vasconcelosia minhoensis LEGE 07310 TaxID=915328 RepID=A0A8J7AGH8_9CYAN|nr:flavin-dependent dehydrogenase [Romeria gracilis]MBE9078449.1 flavin-dependent dehydrogenase [Romeria aff. gracilis LEGE 07310]
MKQLLYLEVPTPDLEAVRTWLQRVFVLPAGDRVVTPDGIRIEFPTAYPNSAGSPRAELSLFVWSVQRTTYLKVFRHSATRLPRERHLLFQLKQQLQQQLQQQFPPQYPALPPIGQQPIFEALAPYYPLTVKYFRKMPDGEADLSRVYWWEKRWRESVRQPETPQQVLFKPDELPSEPLPVATQAAERFSGYDLIYIGGALGVIHAAVMANLGYRVLLVERLPFSKMNREWNISRDEFQSLIDLGLFTPTEFETLIGREYRDGFNKFFDANNPAVAKAPVLHTPTVLNISLNSEKLLRLCGEKLRAAGGTIWDQTDFCWAQIQPDGVDVHTRDRAADRPRIASGRLLIDAMGSASPIAWQLNGGRAFDSVCPTVGASVESGFDPGVWDSAYGDVLFSHGDISRGRQLIWELFPGQGKELTIYLFHYHEVHPDNPGSLLEMYEDFFTILPEYRRCDVDRLVWRKPTFGYIPGHFSVGDRDRCVAYDRLLALGDAASLQSPLVFTGFGSLVRNLARLTELLDIALQHDLLQARHLNQIRAFQSNVAITWLFSKGMMVPTGQTLPPERINAMLNTFFGILAGESPAVADRFIKDRGTWLDFNRMALTAAYRNPALLGWIWQLAGPRDLLRWVGSYLHFTWMALLSLLLGWLPGWTQQQTWLRKRPALWLWLRSQGYRFSYGLGRPTPVVQSIQPPGAIATPVATNR